MPSFSSRISRRSLLALLGGTTLTGCVTTVLDQKPLGLAASFDGPAPPRDGMAKAHWWESFQDARLNALVARGVSRNLDVQGAIAAIRAADADTVAVGAASLPQIDANTNGGRGRDDAGVLQTSAGGAFTASWVIDLFGGQRAARAEASATRDAAWASAEVARITVAAAIASAYVDLRYYQECIALARRSIESRGETLSLTRERAEIGDAGRLDILQAEQVVAQAQATLPALEVGFDQSLNRLATLTDQQVGELRPDLRRGAAQPRATFRASVGIPADVIRARPDIRAAELSFVAAAARIGAAEADLYPSVTLAGSIGINSSRGTTSQKTWQFGPQINLPIFNGSANRARIRAAEARAEQARIAWRSSVLNAIEEVENALAAYSRDSRNINAQSRLVSTTSEMLEVARDTYQAGEADFLTVLDAERAILDARLSLAGAVQKAALSHIRLNVAAASS